MQNYTDFFKAYPDFVDLHTKYCISKYKTEWIELTLTHSMIVAKIALQIVSKLSTLGIKVDEDFIIQSCLLHDIGVYSCFDDELNPDPLAKKYIFHGEIGNEIILKETQNILLARIAFTHTGFGGITIEEIVNNDLKIAQIDRIQISLEEEIVSWADKFHTKWPRFYTIDEIEKSAIKFGERKFRIFEFYKDKFGIPNLESLKAEYDPWNQKMDEFVESLSAK